MADENIVTNIVANADFSSLTSDLRRVTAQLSALQDQANATNKALANQIAVMNRQFGDTLRSTGQFTSHFVTIGSDVEKFGKNLDAGRGKLKDFYGAWQGYHKQAGGLIRDLAKQQVQLQNSILQPLGRNADGMMKFAVHVPRGLDEIKNKTSLAKQELMIMNKVVQEGANQLINWGKNTQWAGRQLTVGLTVPLVAFGKVSADAFRQADEQLTRLTKVYGDLAQTSSSQLKQVRKDVSDTAKDLASSMGASYNQTLALSADIAATGKTGNELLGSIRETTRLSILGEVDRQEAMKATLAIQSAFKQNTDQLGESINFLNAVENQTSTSLADLVEAIPKAGPVVKGLGGSIKDLALYLTAMREGGISASEGANALKSGLAALINPTKVAVGQFKSFGIDLLGIVNNNAGNVTATLLELQKALDTLDPLQKQQAIEQLFGKFQFSRMNALFENLGKQGSQTLKVLELMKASSSDLANIAGRELSQVTESASGKYRRALEALKADLASTGEQFLKISTYVLNFVDKIVNFANNLPGPVKTILGFFGGLTAIAGPLIMLTGVLGNFFGYIVKGVSHFRSLFKGAEGWKMLTPEILAAQKAGDLAADTFYSDTKAAQVLNAALKDLTAQYDALAMRAQSGAVSVKPVINNIAAQAAYGQRIVDPDNPLAGAMGTRASGHMVPRKIDQPRSIFGLVPTSIPVNAAIGENPMIYAEGDLPNVPGLTSISATRTINGQKMNMPVSTGIVASEAAKHHAYQAALAMQSKQEFEALKKTLAVTGTASKEFIDLFDDILPITSQLTAKAATQSAGIVAELKAGKLNVAEAREQIIALNVAIEQEMGVAVSQYAANAGRSVNLMNVPTLNQPVQSPAGKSNMRELFKSRQGGIFDRLASALGVRTSGAGYNIQTTRPKRLNRGGRVFTANDGNIVPGPNVNADVVPAMLTPGEFVVNAKATRANLPLLQAINGSGATGNRLNEGSANPLAGLQRGHISNDLSAFMLYMDTDTNQRIVRGRKYKGFDGITGYEIAQSLASLKRRTGMHPAAILYNLVDRMGGDTRYVGKMYNDIIKDLTSPANANKVFGGLSGASFEDLADKHLAVLKNSKLPSGSNIHDELRRVITDRPDGKSLGLLLDGKKYSSTNALKDSSGKNIMRALLGTSSGFRGKSIIDNLLNFSLGPNPDKAGASIESHGKANTFLGMPLERTATGWAKFGVKADQFSRAMRTRMSYTPRLFRNKGGIVPGYNDGGIVGFSGMPGVGSKNAATALSPGHRIAAASSGQGSFMAGMAMQSAGYMAGGNLGTAMMIGGTAMQMAPMISPILKAASGIKNVSGLLSGLGSIAIKAGTMLRTAFMFMTGPVGLAIAGVTALGAAFLILKDRATKAGAANRLAFGGTEKSFASVGIKNYKTMSDRLKEVNKEMELHKAQVLSVYGSYTKAKPNGLTLTINELNAAIKNAKKNQKEYVDAFNNIDSSRVVKYAQSLKAQFLAMGMSASDATNQIYAIIKASDKSGQAVEAITSKAFVQMQKQTDGIRVLGKQLTKALSSDFNAEEFATGLDTLLNSVTVYQNSLIGTKDKNKQIVDEADALASTMKQVTAIQGSSNELTSTQLADLKNQNLVYNSILGANESLQSITAKILMYQSGMGNLVDLSKMGAEEAVAFANNLSTVQNIMNSITERASDNPLAPLAKMITAASAANDKAAAAAKKAKQADDEYYKNKIKNIDKSIDKIQQETDAKLKLLQLEQEKIDYNDELSKAKLKYEQALASGDMVQAAQAQTNVQKLIADRQRNVTMQNIQDRAQAEIDKLNKEKQALQDARDAQNTQYQKVQATAAQKSADLATLQSYRDRIEAIALRNRGKAKMDATDEKEISNILREMKNSGSSTLKQAAIDIEKSNQGSSAPPAIVGGKPTTTSTAQSITNALNAKLDAEAKNNKLFGTSVLAFDDAVRKFRGETVVANKKTTNYYDALRSQVEAGNPNPTGRTHATGGYISGPGTGTSDSIPAMLSNGEYVINARSVSNIGIPMLDRINKYAAGGLVTNYSIPQASMPKVNMSSGGYAATNNSMYNVSVTLNGSNMDPNDVAKAIDRQLRLREAMNGRRVNI
mgnify:CR=1 FL=1